MTVRILHGDALEQLRTLADESVHSVVTDPPYGLEFMGKDWDRIGNIGKRSHPGFADEPGFKDFRLASYSASGNVKCQVCAKWKWDHEGRKCECGPAAIWPNVRALEGARMQEWHLAWARECLRVLKPGGHLLSFGGSRTYHRMACAIEDAGFEIRDQIMWVYGSGFPKSLDVSKAIDKAAGAEREVLRTEANWGASKAADGKTAFGDYAGGWDVTAPATDAARQWQGWGTALKPAHEPIVVARKPLIGTVAANVLKHGTGAINVDACRIQTDEITGRATYESKGWKNTSGMTGSVTDDWRKGRWPANLIHDGSEEVLAGFPDVHGAGEARAATEGTHSGERVKGWGYMGGPAMRFGDSGSAARFFYTAKASRDDRNIGCEELPLRDGSVQNTSGRRFNPICDNSGQRIQVCECGNCVWSKETNPQRANHHPTVKPTDLMQYLVRLVTPPGGTVLDPFAGSGSTGLAADREGFDAILIEREAEYVEIAKRRIVGDCPLFAELAA